MNKTIHINNADVIRDETRQLLPSPGRDAERHIVVKRTPELEDADEGDTLIYNGMKYRMRWKDVGTDPESPIQFGLLVLGQIDLN